MTTLEEINKLLLDHPDGDLAKQWLQMYHCFAHHLDDVIDGDIQVNVEGKEIGQMLHMTQNIYAHPFYIKYMSLLYPVIRLVHNTYFDTLKMENSNEEWKQRYVSVLKHCGDEVFLAVVEILGGYDKRMELGVAIRENTWKEQQKKNESN